MRQAFRDIRGMYQVALPNMLCIDVDASGHTRIGNFWFRALCYTVLAKFAAVHAQWLDRLPACTHASNSSGRSGQVWWRGSLARACFL